MKYLSLFVLATGMSLSTQAKIWRLNNNAGVVADFTTFQAAALSSTVSPGDTLYLEPSNTTYWTNSFTLAKKLIVVGAGYLLDPANTSFPGNPGLQTSTIEAKIGGLQLGPDASGSKFIGVQFDGTFYLSNTSNITAERVYFPNTYVGFYAGTSTNIVFRKCYFYSTNINQQANTSGSNVLIENNIFNSSNINLPAITGSNNIVRNNSFSNTNSLTLVKSFFINNIVGANAQSILTDCTIKNNIFQIAQTLPATATNNILSVAMADVYEATGSFDGKYKLKATSPAKGKGLTIGSVVNPDCGAFGATDPYVLSGIPNIPTIYTFTAPTSIPSGTPTMNVTFSTRNNN
ncbi:right-handed parallel beta-helix repeat-containing protein [Paraflavitalea sp. CAU 1676]|uniref:right-handed parallel beta-helix repeat-containing protein n=1 Tax=Paraflavitalea sp. CAU 1676 TaxID=3032598 RepID=UPI0023D99899|nr:right-handed parallel beta-helix repeat-containing protein [Paraflavitalea sp. CAU 1676]MDF2193708.1 hypothetical protein [Paraflavitalea sp. CAU 1676]